jgi:hypothetical protein
MFVGFGLHIFGSSNSLLPCITLQPPVFQCLASMLIGAWEGSSEE